METTIKSERLRCIQLCTAGYILIKGAVITKLTAMRFIGVATKFSYSVYTENRIMDILSQRLPVIKMICIRNILALVIGARS